jgi:hypothetical protein
VAGWILRHAGRVIVRLGLGCGDLGGLARYPPAVLGAERGDMTRLGQDTEGRGGTQSGGGLSPHAVLSMT